MEILRTFLEQQPLLSKFLVIGLKANGLVLLSHLAGIGDCY